MNILKLNNMFSGATEYTKIKLCIDNLVATFGEDVVKAVVMSDLSLNDGDNDMSEVLEDEFYDNLGNRKVVK